MQKSPVINKIRNGKYELQKTKTRTNYLPPTRGSQIPKPEEKGGSTMGVVRIEFIAPDGSKEQLFLKAH